MDNNLFGSWENEEAEMAELDALIIKIQQMSPTVKVLNSIRVSQVQTAKALLEEYLEKEQNRSEITVEWFPLLSMATLRAELDDLVVHDPPSFSRIVMLADNFELYPLTNGRVRLALAFQHVMNPIL